MIVDLLLCCCVVGRDEVGLVLVVVFTEVVVRLGLNSKQNQEDDVILGSPLVPANQCYLYGSSNVLGKQKEPLQASPP
jgi:hypothetical protein